MAGLGPSVVRRGRALAAALSAALVLLLGVTPIARAQDPGRWLLTGASSVPNTYWQGLTSDPAESNAVLRRRLPGPLANDAAAAPDRRRRRPRSRRASRRRRATTTSAIRPGIPARAGGCSCRWSASRRGVGNTCGTGAFGVADPDTLAFRYYVKLDPAEIPKAMWAETSPDGSRIWTSSGNDLLAYRSSDVSPANQGPSGPLIHAVRRLDGAVPPTGVTGAVFRKGRLLLAGEAGRRLSGVERQHRNRRSAPGARDADLRRVRGPRRHPDARRQAPLADRAVRPGLRSDLRADQRPAPLRPEAGRTSASGSRSPTPRPRRCRVRCGRRFAPGGTDTPCADARVRFAGGTARTNRHGLATVSTTLELPGRFRALVRKGESYGVSALVPSAWSRRRRAPAPRSGAR